MDRMSVCDERNNNIILKKGTSQKRTVIYEAIPLSQSKFLRRHGLDRIENSVSFTVNLHRRKASFGFHPLLLPLSVV